MATFGQMGMISSVQPRPCMVETSSITLSTADTIKFIQLYQQQEILWNVNLPDHTNKPKRSESLLKISRLMGYNWTEQQVKDKILSLRSRYSKEIVKVRVSIATGADHYAPIWRFFPLLDSFLRPFCTTRKTDTPVVRAFHRRLIEGMGHSTGSSPAVVPVSHPGTVAASLHIGEVPLPASGYYGNYNQNAPLLNNSYQDIDNYNDDDLQIIEEFSEDTVDLCIEDDDNSVLSDDRTFWSSGLEGNVGDNSKNAGTNFSIIEGNVDGSCCSNQTQGNAVLAQSSENDPKTPQEDGVSQTIITHHSSVGKEGNQPSSEEMVTSSACSASTQGEVGSLMQNVSSSSSPSPSSALTIDNEPSKRGEQCGETSSASGEIHVKREKNFSPSFHPPPSPPLPPPVRQRGLLTDSFSWQLVEANSMEQASVYRHLNANEGSYSRGQVTTGNATIVPGSSNTQTGEPAMKKIKQEPGTSVHNAQSVHNERIPHVKFNPTNSHFNTSCMNNGDMSNGSIGKWSKLNSADSVQTSQELRKMSLSNQTTKDSLNCTASEVTNIASQLTNQMTNVLTRQMTNLLQTLVPNLVEKSKPNVTDDSELAFVNHVVCELKKLDEDLQAEVKFSIQKALYEAQKDMRQRRSQHSESLPDLSKPTVPCPTEKSS